MRKLSEEFKNHLKNEVTTFATCWQIKRKDGVLMGFTDFDADIEFDSILYKSSNSFIPSEIESNSDLSVDNLEVQGVLDSLDISEEDIKLGLYDFAEIVIFMVNYKDIGMGSINLKTGWLGEIKFSKNKFIAEVRGLVQALRQGIGNLYSPNCRAVFGDEKCKLDINNFKHNGVIEAVISENIFKINNLGQDNNFFTNGILRFKSGNNQDSYIEIKRFFNDEVELVMPHSKPINVDDEFEIIAGCNKSFNECVNKFNNAVNFRGEPHVPGIDKILQTAGTRN